MNKENLNFIIGTSGIICYLLLLLYSIYGTMTYEPNYNSTNIALMMLVALITIPIISLILGLLASKTDLEYLKEDLKELNIRWLE